LPAKLDNPHANSQIRQVVPSAHAGLTASPSCGKE
jgi:hypothetical protein